MSYFYDTFMGHRREQWLRSIHAIEVQTGGSWHRGAINKKLVEGDTLVIYAPSRHWTPWPARSTPRA